MRRAWRPCSTRAAQRTRRSAARRPWKGMIQPAGGRRLCPLTRPPAGLESLAYPGAAARQLQRLVGQRPTLCEVVVAGSDECDSAGRAVSLPLKVRDGGAKLWEAAEGSEGA